RLRKRTGFWQKAAATCCRWCWTSRKLKSDPTKGAYQMSRLQVGILGCGSFAREHARVLLELQDQVALAAVCDRHPERAAALAQQFTGGQAAVYTDHHDLIEKAGLDVLIVALPPYGHSDEV